MTRQNLYHSLIILTSVVANFLQGNLLIASVHQGSLLKIKCHTAKALVYAGESLDLKISIHNPHHYPVKISHKGYFSLELKQSSFSEQFMESEVQSHQVVKIGRNVTIKPFESHVIAFKVAQPEMQQLDGGYLVVHVGGQVVSARKSKHYIENPRIKTQKIFILPKALKPLPTIKDLYKLHVNKATHLSAIAFASAQKSYPETIAYLIALLENPKSKTMWGQARFALEALTNQRLETTQQWQSWWVKQSQQLLANTHLSKDMLRYLRVQITTLDFSDPDKILDKADLLLAQGNILEPGLIELEKDFLAQQRGFTRLVAIEAGHELWMEHLTPFLTCEQASGAAYWKTILALRGVRKHHYGQALSRVQALLYCSSGKIKRLCSFTLIDLDEVFYYENIAKDLKKDEAGKKILAESLSGRKLIDAKHLLIELLGDPDDGVSAMALLSLQAYVSTDLAQKMGKNVKKWTIWVEQFVSPISID